MLKQQEGGSVEVWCQDEARLGLKPILRRQWAKRGKRPKAVGQTRFQWLYVYGFVRPATGQTYWLLLPTVNVEAMNAALAAFAKDCGIGKDKRVVLVLDNAGWHRSKKVVLPEGLSLEFLPPSTPELQPAERLWPLLREAVANRLLASLEALEELLLERIQVLRQQQPRIHAITHYHWFPTT